MDATNFQPETSLILAIIYLLLHLYGWGYNTLIAFAERKGYLEGHTAYSVALGVIFTLAPFLIFKAIPILWVYMAFVASGSPMIIGAWWRHVQARRQERDAIQRGDCNV